MPNRVRSPPRALLQLVARIRAETGGRFSQRPKSGGTAAEETHFFALRERIRSGPLIAGLLGQLPVRPYLRVIAEFLSEPGTVRHRCRTARRRSDVLIGIGREMMSLYFYAITT